MTNEGERLDEPTSYGLQPPGASDEGGVPRQPSSPQPGQQQPGHQPGQHQPEHQHPGQHAAAPAAPPAAYEPTQAVAPQHTPGPGQDPGTGRVIGGRYRLTSRLGHGGMGTVWRAHDDVVERDVAVKEPRLPQNLSEAERQVMYQRMRREARTAASIDHPSVVTIHDVVVENGQPWIVMELVQGRSLADVLKEGTLDAREAARIGHAVVGALDAAHQRGVLHRDVKPDNVLLGRFDRVVLTDFGIAQVEGEQQLTETGAFVGSPEYIAPERVLGQRPGPESDLWSLGVVLYAATEGVSPFRRSNTPATLQAVLSVEPQRPVYAANGSGALGMTITRLLQKEPGRRPDAGEVRATLADVARPVPQQKPPSPDGGNALVRALRAFGGKLRTSRKWQFGTGGAVVAAAAALTLFLVLTADDLPDGWKLRNEDKRVKASLAVPEDYVRSADVDEVTFKDRSGDYTISLNRAEKGVENTALKEANSRKRWYEDGADVNYSSTMALVKSSVDDEVKHQGKTAASITTTFKKADGSDSKGPYLRRYELVYVNPDDVGWRLSVEGPARGEPAAKVKGMYDDAVRSLNIHEL